MGYLEKAKVWKDFKDLEPNLKKELESMDDNQLKEAFTDDEKRHITLSHIINENNDYYDTNSGADTDDYVFLLSLSEAVKYFDDDAARIALTTQYAINNGIRKNSKRACVWWLRSPGGNSERAADVDEYGVIHDYGGGIHVEELAVRPVLWIIP